MEKKVNDVIALLIERYGKARITQMNEETLAIARKRAGLPALAARSGSTACLKCQKAFTSPDKIKIRICDSCKGQDFWQEGEGSLNYTPGLPASHAAAFSDPTPTVASLRREEVSPGAEPKPKDKSPHQKNREFVQVRSLRIKQAEARKKGKQ